ncbi:MAG: hypothetical protein WCS77_05340 [Elusimicrobiaceae bacterium]
MNKNKGMCLAELLIAVGLLAGVGLATSSVSVFVSRAGSKIEKAILPMQEANLAVEAVAQRIKRAPVMKNGKNYTILNNALASSSGSVIQYKSNDGKRLEEFSVVGSNFVYKRNADKAPSTYDVLARDVSAVNFKNDYSNRVAVELTLNNKQGTVRTSVMPVNTSTTRNIIN